MTTTTHPTISKERSKEKKDFPWVKAEKSLKLDGFLFNSFTEI